MYGHLSIASRSFDKGASIGGGGRRGQWRLIHRRQTEGQSRNGGGDGSATMENQLVPAH